MAYIQDEIDQNGMLVNQNKITLDDVRYGSGYSNIFIHNSRLAFSTANNRYSDVLVCCPLWHKNQWHSILAITQDEPNRVILNSNSFYWEDKKGLKHQNTHHRIHDRMIFNYHRMRNYPVAKHSIISGESFLLANAFSGVNSGHELSAFLDVIQYIRAHPSIKHIVILKASHWFPNNLILLKLLLGDAAHKLFEMNWNTVYRFTDIHIVRQNIVGIDRHTGIIDELKRHIMREVTNVKKHASVVLLKTHRDKNVITRANQLICEKMLKHLETSGWEVVNPETCNIIHMCAMLMHAKRIVFSHGSILYTHMIFFNPHAQLKWIAVGREQLSDTYRLVKTSKLQVYRIPSRDLDTNDGHIPVLAWLVAAPDDRMVAAPGHRHIPKPVVTSPAPSPSQIAAPGGVSNSGLLQEHFFFHAIKEVVNSVTPGLPFRVGVDHKTAKCFVSFPKGIQKTYPVIFPMERINLIKQYWKPQKNRPLKYFYRGMISGISAKQWILPYASKPNAEVTHNTRGRGKHKYEADHGYYETMCNSLFVLAPTDVYPWSYRFLEAIICQCIPIINTTDIHAIAGGFHYYLSSDEHVWREDWVRDNWNKLLKIHTLSENTELRHLLQTIC